MTKSVVDFLWDWADEQGEWAQHLVSCVIRNESLTEQERIHSYQLFLKQIGASSAVNTSPVYTRSRNDSGNLKLLLQSLSEVRGVNKLAQDQEMKFSTNLTVVYGNNGSGKTGYSRILKSLGFSYDQHTKILPNVFNDQQIASAALIKYSVETTTKEFLWNEQLKSEELSSIGVFNTDCVKLSLDGKRNFIATPTGFHLFNLISDELENVGDILNAELTAKRKQPQFLEQLTIDTEVYNYVTGINHNTKQEEIDAVFNFNEEDEVQLQQLELEKQQLNKPLIINEIDKCKKQITELESLVSRLKKIDGVFNKTFWDNHFSSLEHLQVLEGKQQEGIEEIAKDKGVAFYQSVQFLNFLKAAENYIKIIGNDFYPTDKDSCVYCLQPLNSQSRMLLASYRTLLNDTTKTDIEVINNNIQKNKQMISFIGTELVLNHDSFGLDDNNTPILPIEISNVFSNLEAHKSILIGSEMQKRTDFNIEYQRAITCINERLAKTLATLEAKEELLNVVEQKETEIQGLINGYKDSKKISTNKGLIHDYINNLKYAHLLDRNKQKFNTRSLSQKSTSARKELIEQRFEEIFTEELQKMRCPNNISINFGTQRSVPNIEQNINNKFTLQEVFSEGEQKSVALANFITELRISGKNGPVVFDDPVNSLDHERISIVAKRLIQLSLERQMIIFTHNVLLFYAIEQIIKDSKINISYNYYSVEKDLEYTGYLYENVPPHKESFKTYEAKINVILNSPKEVRTQRESKLAQEGYNHLRSAIELLVEDEIFKQVVKRYKRNIMFGQFEKINGTTLDVIKQELTEVFNQCCSYIEAHSNPEELAELPTLEQLNRDFIKIKEIRKLFPQ